LSSFESEGERSGHQPERRQRKQVEDLVRSCSVVNKRARAVGVDQATAELLFDEAFCQKCFRMRTLQEMAQS
jgi:hypothetical protein